MVSSNQQTIAKRQAVLLENIRANLGDIDVENEREVVECFSAPLTEEQTAFLTEWVKENNVEKLFYTDYEDGGEHKKHKQLVILTLINTGFLRVIPGPETIPGIPGSYALIFPNGDTTFVNFIVDGGEDALTNYLVHTTKRLCGEENAVGIARQEHYKDWKLEKPAHQLSLYELRQVCGIGLAELVTEERQWNEHKETFVELLNQLPTHIATHYQSLASRWLLPHMLQSDEISNRPTPLKDWVAKVSANENRAPATAVAPAIGGA